MKVEYSKVEELLKEHKSLTADEIAEKLGLEITQENRKKVMFDVRKQARKVVDKNSGKRTEYNDDKKLIYSI